VKHVNTTILVSFQLVESLDEKSKAVLSIEASYNKILGVIAVSGGE